MSELSRSQKVILGLGTFGVIITLGVVMTGIFAPYLLPVLLPVSIAAFFKVVAAFFVGLTLVSGGMYLMGSMEGDSPDAEESTARKPQQAKPTFGAKKDLRTKSQQQAESSPKDLRTKSQQQAESSPTEDKVTVLPDDFAPGEDVPLFKI